MTTITTATVKGLLSLTICLLALLSMALLSSSVKAGPANSRSVIARAAVAQARMAAPEDRFQAGMVSRGTRQLSACPVDRCGLITSSSNGIRGAAFPDAAGLPVSVVEAQVDRVHDPCLDCHVIEVKASQGDLGSCSRLIATLSGEESGYGMRRPHGVA